MHTEEFMKLVGYVTSSTYRKRTLLVMGNQHMTPTLIAKKSGIRTNHMSKVLKELKDKGIVVCINEEARKGRLYITTDLGNDIRFYIMTREV